MSQVMHSVTSLVHYIKSSLDQDMRLRSLKIKGEISNLTKHRSGHWYFSLKDTRAKISCVMFASNAARCTIDVKEGMQVIVSGSVSMYEAGGSLQLYVTAIQNDGLGDLFLQLEAIKKKLAAEGLFAPERKKPLPLYPMSIGLVTAKSGAALQDMIATIARRWPIANVSLYPAQVQGIQASQSIITMLKEADAMGHDVILLARGGGAIEDLWCFNDEALARVIADMQTVLVSGVGHESDTTLVDYVSDARAATPTAAAELITPDIYEVKQQLAQIQTKLLHKIENQLILQRQHLEHIKASRYLQDPLSYIDQERLKLAMNIKAFGYMQQNLAVTRKQLSKLQNDLAVYSQKLTVSSPQHLKEQKRAMSLQMEKLYADAQANIIKNSALLDAYSPLKILSRGYQIVYQKDQVIKSIHDLDLQKMIRIRMQDGFATASVLEKEEIEWKKN